MPAACSSVTLDAAYIQSSRFCFSVRCAGSFRLVWTGREGMFKGWDRLMKVSPKRMETYTRPVDHLVIPCSLLRSCAVKKKKRSGSVCLGTKKRLSKIQYHDPTSKSGKILGANAVPGFLIDCLKSVDFQGEFPSGL